MIPTVSVLIAAYQAESFVEEAVRSALSQAMVAVEVVVVDDASRDGTVAVLDALAGQEPRLKVVALPVNRGVAGARNAGLDACTGEWVAVLDCDDCFHSERLHVLLAAAERTGADMVSDNLALVSFPGRHPIGIGLDGHALPEDGWIDCKGFIDSNTFEAGTGINFGYLKPMVKRSLLLKHKIRYREDLRICEDYHFFLDCLLHGARWYTLSEPLYAYSIRAGSLSRRLTARHLDHALVLSRAMTEDPALPQRLRRPMERRHRNMLKMLDYLTMKDAVKAFDLAGALSQMVRHPAVFPVMAQGLWRNRILRKWRRVRPGAHPERDLAPMTSANGFGAVEGNKV